MDPEIIYPFNMSGVTVKFLDAQQFYEKLSVNKFSNL